MAERMVRTQVYLPPKVHAELKRRAEKHGLTLAVQIREALEDYLRRANGAEAETDPLDFGDLFEIIGRYGGSGLGDGAERHDYYIYGDPHGEKRLAKRREEQKARSQTVRERSPAYRAKKRPPIKRKGGGR